jgi:hypothetical protein
MYILAGDGVSVCRSWYTLAVNRVRQKSGGEVRQDDTLLLFSHDISLGPETHSTWQGFANNVSLLTCAILTATVAVKPQ